MTSFAYWSSWAGPDEFMCDICYAIRKNFEASEDEHGVKRSVCEPCSLQEAMVDLVKVREDEIHELVAEVRVLDVENTGLREALVVEKSSATHLRCLFDTAFDEVNELRAQLVEERSRYTLGGVPPGYQPWGNVKLPPPPSAESGRFDGS
jgi:predicted nuclease with TOPRIM domain